MANTQAEVENKLNTANLVGEIEGISKQHNWKFWLLVPVALAAIAGSAFFVVRRIRRG
jgi:hypothetical protein